MAKYLALYVSEASDHLAKLGAGLVQLETTAREGGEIQPLVDELFRHAHSVKGMSAAMELGGVASLAHRAEDLVAVFRARAAAPDAASVDLLLAAADALGAMVQAAGGGSSPDPDPALLSRLSAAADRARATTSGPPPAAVAGAPAPAAPSARPLVVTASVAASAPAPAVRAFLVLKRLQRLGTVRRATPGEEELRAGHLPGRRLEVVLESAEECGALSRALAQISDLEGVEIREDAAPAGAPAPALPARREAEADGGRTVRVRVELLDSFLDAVGELILATARVRELGRGVPEPLGPALEEGFDRLHVTVKDLHDKVMAVRMTPLSVVTERLPRAARDLARRTGKQVEVEIRGDDIELDRAILDELGDPLLHLLRNAVDHGLEPPEERQRAGKPAGGRLTVAARRERDRVVVEVADDGRGMDADALRAAAVARGTLTEEAAAALGRREALLLACLPGVTTARELSDVSGRGVGMDAVKRTVEAMGGTLDVESAAGAGTRWTLRLPMTVVVQQMLLVEVAGEVLGIPITKVHGAAQLEPAARGGGPRHLLHEGQPLPVRDLGALLGLDAAGRGAPQAVVVAEGDGGPVALAVDALLGQQEAVLKPLVRPFDQVAGLSAVTVLASGRPAFVLDVPRLVAP